MAEMAHIPGLQVTLPVVTRAACPDKNTAQYYIAQTYTVPNGIQSHSVLLPGLPGHEADMPTVVGAQLAEEYPYAYGDGVHIAAILLLKACTRDHTTQDGHVASPLELMNSYITSVEKTDRVPLPEQHSFASPTAHGSDQHRRANPLILPGRLDAPTPKSLIKSQGSAGRYLYVALRGTYDERIIEKD